VPALPLSLIDATLAPVCLPDPGLARCLVAVPDPRDPRAIRHSLTSLLMASVAAVLAGARSFTAIGEWVADAPPRVLAALGIRHDPLTGQFEPPDEATIRRVLEAVDADALDAAVGSWLASRARAGDQTAGPGRRRAVAVHGKSLRGTRHSAADGQPAHLLAAADQRTGAVLSQRDVDGKTNEVRREAPCRIPNSVRRNSEGSSWARWLTRTRKAMGTKACHEYLRLCPKTGAARRESPRDMAKARLPESQSPVMQVFIHRKWSLKPVPGPVPCYLVGGATSGAAGDAQ
jgi:hypothetical protein